MSNNSIAEKTISNLKLRLDTAISARLELEAEFNTQSLLLTDFIGKLSQACKGTDISLDNKLANLRAAIKKSAKVVDLEKDIKNIAVLLQKHSLNNDKNIKKIHEQLQACGSRLQKLDNLPVEQRRNLKALTAKMKHSQDALVQYLPLMSEFIALYESALQLQNRESTIGLLNANNSTSPSKTANIEDVPDNSDAENEQTASKVLLKRFNAILKTLVTSTRHKADIKKIKASLKGTISNQFLMTNCLNVFDLIIEDLKQERSTAKIFLTTLSETLISVQASVGSTIAKSAEASAQHDQFNKALKDKIGEMGLGINAAGSLNDMKVDVNEKLLQIAKTLEKKTKLEEEQRLALVERLNNMSTQVEELELQSQDFKKRIQEQQARSMQDALTKLSNRAAFDDCFAREIVRFHHKNFDLALAVVDLDNFKRINDTYGHTAGDKTLKVIANALTKVIGDDTFIGRYGGEEFVLIFSHYDKATVMNKLNILRKSVASLPFTFKNTRINITLSIGVTLIEENDNVHSSFDRADTALYQAKKDGKNRVIYG